MAQEKELDVEMNGVVMRGEGGRFLRASARSARAVPAFDASARRLGRVQRACRRCFIAGDFEPRTMRQLVAFAYPVLAHPKNYHRWSVRRALLAIGAKPIGRLPTGGRPGIWSLAACVEKPSENSRSEHQ
jgi:hypothetical protein